MLDDPSLSVCKSETFGNLDQSLSVVRGSHRHRQREEKFDRIFANLALPELGLLTQDLPLRSVVQAVYTVCASSSLRTLGFRSQLTGSMNLPNLQLESSLKK